MPRGSAALAAVLAALIPICAAIAQGPVQRDSLEMLRDSLVLSRDSVALLAVEARTIGIARRNRDDPMIHLRLGFIALRIADLTGGTRHPDDAGSEFEWAAELRPNWPYPWFGLGLAEAHFPDRAHGFAGGFWTMLGIDRDTRAGDAFLRSIRADPTFVDGLVAFAETARQQRIKAPIAEALDALRAVTASPLGWHPDLLLERGRLERLAGSPDSAAVAFRRALLLGASESIASLELARTLPLTSDTVSHRLDGETPVEVAYYAGAASDDRDVVAEYRRDLQPITNDSTLAEFDKTRGEARVQWLQDFWRRTAAADLRSPASRLAEHYRRWSVVLRQFRLPPFRRSYEWGVEIYHSGETELDDRGIVWLRQGPPTTRIIWPRSETRTVADAGPRMPTASFAMSQDTFSRIRSGPRSGRGDGPMFNAQGLTDAETFGNETWRYARPDGDLVLHFMAREEDDYRLVESIFELNVSYDALAHRERELPGLAEMLGAGRFDRVEVEEEDRLRGRKAISTATTTSSWFRSYRFVLGGHVQWLSAGTKQGLPLVHIVYAVDAALLRALPPTPGGMIALEARAVMLDGRGDAVATLDTVQLVPRPGPATKMIAMRAEIAAPPGPHKVRFGVEASPVVGDVFPLDSIVVPDVGADTLALSSVLVGIPGRALPWPRTASDTSWLDATSHYAPHDTVTAYFEAYGVRPGVPYTMRLAVTRQRTGLSRLLAGHRDAIALTEQLTFSGTAGRVTRAIDLGGLEPGAYLLEVTVENGKHRIVRRRGLIVR